MDVSDFGPFKLSKGSHSGPEEGMCVMEMVSFLAGEQWSDMPSCASPVVSRFCQGLNDYMPQNYRDKLQAFIPRLINTADLTLDEERAEFLAWKSIKIFTPLAFDVFDLKGRATTLRDFDEGLGLSAAADAARAAARAAAAAAAADAADAARAADARSLVWDEALKVLDELLKIGSPENVLTTEQQGRIEPLRELMRA